MQDSIIDWIKIVWAMVSGFFMAALGYFIPIKNIVVLLVVFFLFDVVFGFWAAKKVRKERFSMKIIWKTTMPRMLISIALIILAFSWDKEYEQDFVATYKVIGWFISGVLLANIVQNGYYITKWDVLLGLGNLLKKRIKEKMGLDNEPD